VPQHPADFPNVGIGLAQLRFGVDGYRKFGVTALTDRMHQATVGGAVVIGGLRFKSDALTIGGHLTITGVTYRPVAVAFTFDPLLFGRFAAHTYHEQYHGNNDDNTTTDQHDVATAFPGPTTPITTHPGWRRVRCLCHPRCPLLVV